MDRDTLRKVQLTQLEIAKEIKRVCGQLDIKYFLDAGTLLGAVRHKGFIPWDDDMDMGMLRKEYERFLKEAPAVLDDKYIIQGYYNDHEYDNVFIKVRKKDTIYKEEGSPVKMKNCGIYVDIFPYDVYPDDCNKRNKQGAKLDKYRMQIFAKTKARPWAHLTSRSDVFKVKIKCILYRISSVHIPLLKLFEQYDKEKQRYNGEVSENFYVHCSASVYGSWVIPKRCFDEYVDLQFEDTMFSCPKGYDEYLRCGYGDYMTLPPENERENRHRIIELKL